MKEKLLNHIIRYFASGVVGSLDKVVIGGYKVVIGYVDAAVFT